MTCNRGNKLNKYISDYVVFDLETTGVSTTDDAVIEISAVKVVNRSVVDEFTSLVNPEKPIPPIASEVNGITDDMVKDYPSFDVVLKSFIDFIGDNVLVGHNIHRFDMKFIWRDTERYFGKTVENDFIDTLSLAKIFLPDMDSHTLVNLSYHYGIKVVGAHRALNDCKMNQLVFEKLADEMAHPSIEVRICPQCSNFLKKRKSKYGEFWGCSSYPNCRYTEK